MNISDIKVSIVIPVYNAENYLRKCIDSVKIQTHKSLRIILIDDGSSDNSLDICEEYGEKDSRIEVCHTANGGSVAARKVDEYQLDLC